MPLPLHLLASGGPIEGVTAHALPEVPYLAVLPFVFMLLGIAILPLLAHRWWESNRNRFLFAALVAIPFGFWWVPNYGWHRLTHEWQEYLSFIMLLASLYVASGGIYLRGNLRGRPGTNVAICAIGAVLANVLGTTGASMVLIRPYLKANAHRPMVARIHQVVFFIFVVSNVGGCLTPLGDPPLFLGFLKGVPFAWTFGLWKEWALAIGLILGVFYAWDRLLFTRHAAEEPEVETPEPFGIEGLRNIPLLLCVMGAVIAKGTFGWGFGPQEIIMAAVAVVSVKITPRKLHLENHFTFGPILEVAILFAGIFTVMVAPLAILETEGARIGLVAPWHFFWATGALSSFLDNAPTYLVFGQTAASAEGVHTIGELVQAAPVFLAAVSTGAVFMGAMTYIGNAPNFMVKAIAEENAVEMPSFFGYMRYSIGILIPLYVIVTFVFMI